MSSTLMINDIDRILINKIAVLGEDFYLVTSPNDGRYGVRRDKFRGTIWTRYDEEKCLIELYPTADLLVVAEDIESIRESFHVDERSGLTRHLIKLSDYEPLMINIDKRLAELR